MKKSPLWIRSVLLSSLSILFILSLFVTPTRAAAPNSIKHGSQGIDVWELQRRLYMLGLFTGQIDGIADERTITAIRSFQRLNGLSPTGNVNKQTADQLQANSLSIQELDLLTRLVYAESRGEPFEGQVAVAAVVLNRINSTEFPNTISEVIYARNAFSSVRDGQLSTKANKKAREAVLVALRGEDPSKGSLYFYNPETSTSEWIFTRKQQVVIGDHVFAT